MRLASWTKRVGGPDLLRAIVTVALLGAALAAPAAAQRPAALSPFAPTGCWRLTVGPWSGALPSTGVPEAHTPPSHFRLDSTSARGGGGYAVQPAKLMATSRMDADWQPLGADSVRIAWSTGFVGVSLRVRLIGDTLAGSATTFHDAHRRGEPPDPTASVRAVREACAPLPNGCFRFDRPYFEATDYRAGGRYETAIVRLDTLHFEHRGTVARRLSAFQIDSVIERSGNWLRRPYWMMVGDSAYLSWSTGLHGPLLTLGMRGDSLVGRVVFSSDAIPIDPTTRLPIPPRSEPAWAVKTDCPGASR